MDDIKDGLDPQNNTDGSALDDGKGKEVPEGKDQGTPEAKPGGEGKGDSKDDPASKPKDEPKKEEPKKDEGDKPVAYADFKVPDGIVTDNALLGEFKDLAGKMKLSQEQAQALVDLQTKAIAAQTEQFAKTRQGWLEEIYADTDFGGDAIKQTTDDARLALQEYDPSGKVLKLMVGTGFQDNPDILRFLARVGRERKKEGRILNSRSQAQPDEPDLGSRLWPNMK